MYLNEPTLSTIVQKQFRFKLNAHAAAFTTLVLLQIAGMFLAFTSNKFSYYFDINSKITMFDLSNNTNMGISLIWAFILGIMLTTATRRNEAFSFVTTRISSHVANLLFMVTASIVAGVIAVLSGPALKFLGLLFYKDMVVYTPGIIDSPTDFFARVITAFSYIMLLFLVGYTISSLVQLNKMFIALFVVLWIAFTTVTESWNGNDYMLEITNFYATEQSILLFLLKIVGTILVLFTASTFITNRLEVRN